MKALTVISFAIWSILSALIFVYVMSLIGQGGAYGDGIVAVACVGGFGIISLVIGLPLFVITLWQWDRWDLEMRTMGFFPLATLGVAVLVGIVIWLASG
jgi:hypothetical protein